VLALLALAGCGGSAQSADEGGEGFTRVTDAIEGLSGPARERKLVELARAEGGQLRVYASLTEESQTAVTQAFEKAYPGVDLSVYRGTSEAVAQRATQEARAGFRGADAVDTNGSEMTALARQDIFVAHRPPGLSRLVPGSEHRGWTATRFNKYVVSWNTRLVPAGRQPRSWEDLAEPRWRGQLALEESDSDWYKSLRDHWVQKQGKSEPEADRLLAAIARNGRVVGSHAVMTQLLGAGEHAVAASNYLHLARDSKDKGAPVEFAPLVGPVFSRAQGIGLLKSARHPAAAILYVEWLTGDGQRVLKANNVEPARRDLVDDLGVREVQVDVEEYVSAQQQWSDRYDRLLRLSRTAQDAG
jgi:iron(III) transport system substrate-binding protein